MEEKRKLIILWINLWYERMWCWFKSVDLHERMFYRFFLLKFSLHLMNLCVICLLNWTFSCFYQTSIRRLVVSVTCGWLFYERTNDQWFEVFRYCFHVFQFTLHSALDKYTISKWAYFAVIISSGFPMSKPVIPLFTKQFTIAGNV